MGTGILVIVETDGGVPRKTATELIAKATALGLGPVSAAVIGPVNAGSLGGVKVYQAQSPLLANYSTGATVKALQALVAAANPAAVLAPASLNSKDALPRLAVRLGAGLAAEVTDLRVEGGQLVGKRPIYAGKALVDVRVSGLGIFTVRPNSFPGGVAPAGSAEIVAVDAGITAADVDTELVEVLAPASKAVDLTEADRIVSGGRSLKSKESFDAVVRPLAAAANATAGASRAAVDAGYAGHGDQVGQTGKVVNPSLYIALGISGAIQHLAGMRTSRVIVSVNKDPEAPIFQYTTYGIVGDLFEIAPLLQKELSAH
ncbi:MAG TPA: electron transfer flavoprotein subunit alpha/FixB family protein [Myxococcota bacterium]|nr:electron transfer flavoprotein subunit alpha/FixB family protein [Myxococcota bacterium]HNH46335.1 electron transfer flavoprotein subunit alpha/FixB family protein [Myxococcota bacterium]